MDYNKQIYSKILKRFAASEHESQKRSISLEDKIIG
jgi:hypothetical protein